MVAAIRAAARIKRRAPQRLPLEATDALMVRRTCMFLCERCRQPAQVFTGSIFNQQLVCVPCVLKERAHPRFLEAAEAEAAAVRRGEFNFPGIGLPPDLQHPEGGATGDPRKQST